MNNQPPRSIGLAELIQQIKGELLSTVPGRNSDAPILFVESVELELQVTVNREGTGKIKIDVLTFGGGELGGNLKREDVHTVKVKLAPLFDKERLMEFYQTLHPNQVPTSVKQSLDGLLKGEEENLANQF